MTNYSVEISNVSKSFGRVEALKNINLQIKEGEVFAYIGPNGAGKSTTIRVLLGILQATKGNVKVFGKDAWKDAVDIHRRIAYVPGDVNLWPNLTGGEVIDLFVNLRGSHDKALRERLIRDFNLDPTKKCRTYSKGNRQKVALIAAFASEVDLYVLDEPTSGLDPLMEQVFQACVLDQKNKGKGVFLSSHIMSEVERLCDRVGIIREGELVEVGTLDDLRHLTRYVMQVATERPIEGLDKLDGIHDITDNDGLFTFNVDADKMGSIINHINTFGIKKLDSTPPSLEELFMKHYKKEEVS
ncbi:MAG: ABC transporter ATP-binding protein [Oscillospiraceae bacterium]|jgi:ABC-2 type transport system ATP-binding protein|nr:ABC transporter ATP-binding protein [Oscillospiraceae bacterium]